MNGFDTISGLCKPGKCVNDVTLIPNCVTIAGLK